MARAPIDGIGVAGRAAPQPPPRALVVPLAPQSRSVAAVAEEDWQRLC